MASFSKTLEVLSKDDSIENHHKIMSKRHEYYENLHRNSAKIEKNGELHAKAARYHEIAKDYHQQAHAQTSAKKFGANEDSARANLASTKAKKLTHKLVELDL